MSADNNPMVLVELKSLPYQYGTSTYAVDRVNGTMYGKFSVGYKIIPEKATVIPQFQLTPIGDEYRPTSVNTLPGTTDSYTYHEFYAYDPGITNVCVTKCSSS